MQVYVLHVKGEKISDIIKNLVNITKDLIRGKRRGKDWIIRIYEYEGIYNNTN